MEFLVWRTSKGDRRRYPVVKGDFQVYQKETFFNTYWFVEINDIDHLMSFIDAQGYEVVINRDNGTPQIEIVDDYR